MFLTEYSALVLVLRSTFAYSRHRTLVLALILVARGCGYVASENQDLPTEERQSCSKHRTFQVHLPILHKGNQSVRWKHPRIDRLLLACDVTEIESTDSR